MVDLISQCDFCKHIYSVDKELPTVKDYKCKAFPKGIPEVIIDNEHDHTKPYPGDNGIRYEPYGDPSKVYDPRKANL